MSDLRKQLQSARDEYLAERYRGNLAEDLLMPRMRIGRWIAFAGPIAAVAAALIVYIGIVHHGADRSGPNSVAYHTPSVAHPSHAKGPRTNAPAQTTEQTATISDDSMMPQYLELTPSAETFSVPAVELVPSFSDASSTTDSNSTSTTREST